MLNKRAATLLALVLAGSMVLSGPSAVLASASAGDSEETSQTETREKESESKDPVEKKEIEEEEKAEKGKEEKGKEEKGKKAEKDMSDSREADSDDGLLDSAADEASEKTEEESPAHADVSGDGTDVSDNTNDDPSVSGDKTEEGDGTRTISTNEKTTISGNISENIVVASPQGANLTFKDLKITKNPALRIESGTGRVQIHLTGNNVLDGIQINNSAGVQVYGPGILKVGGSITGAAVISGGNIQAPFKNPRNGRGVSLYAVSVNGLKKNETYTISGMRAGNPQASYSYGSQILADENGRLFMYLPAGEAQVTLGGDTYQGNVVSGNASSELKIVQTPPPDNPTDPPVQPTDVPDQEAKEAENGLYWINEGATYRSGANLQFYATGAGYSPQAPQTLDPVRGATRYIPTDWQVNPSSGTAAANGSWKKYTEETTGQNVSGGNYVPGEYRFKDSFVVSTNQATAVPYTLRVGYKREVYNGDQWKADGTSATKSVSFYIRNISLTTTPSYTPTPTYTTTPYTRSGVTTTAARSSVSSNARNASTMDDTPISALVLLMIAAAGSGAAIFRKKRNRS